jgi:pimeloyl-ACP methyl ester carboxylesterase
MNRDLKPLILIHGLFMHKSVMWWAGRWLSQFGFEPYLFGYNSFFNNISDHTERLFDFINRHNLKDSELYFVTHSLGSIVLRDFSLRYGSEFKLTRAVHLGPPHKGSQTARAISKVPLLAKILGPSFREICQRKIEKLPPSPEVGIVAGEIKLKRGYYFVLNGPNDGIVEIEETLIEGAKEHLVLKGTHSLMPVNKAHLQKARNFLLTGTFRD